MDREELLRRLAGDERHESQPLVNLKPDTCFDPKSIQWYRAVFTQRQPGHETIALSDLEFLQHWGLLVEQAGQLRPTRASVLLFGAPAALNQILPRPVLDCQWHRTTADDIFNG